MYSPALAPARPRARTVKSAVAICLMIAQGGGLGCRAVPDWFVTNVADAEAVRHPRAGIRVRLEPEGERLPEVGVNIRVVEPGQPASLYHSEDAQEDFLVL